MDSGISSVDIISPAFTADCLETLEELDIGYREFFMEKGGKNITIYLVLMIQLCS